MLTTAPCSDLPVASSNTRPVIVPVLADWAKSLAARNGIRRRVANKRVHLA